MKFISYRDAIKIWLNSINKTEMRLFQPEIDVDDESALNQKKQIDPISALSGRKQILFPIDVDMVDFWLKCPLADVEIWSIYVVY